MVEWKKKPDQFVFSRFSIKCQLSSKYTSLSWPIVTSFTGPPSLRDSSGGCLALPENEDNSIRATLTAVRHYGQYDWMGTFWNELPSSSCGNSVISDGNDSRERLYFRQLTVNNRQRIKGVPLKTLPAIINPKLSDTHMPPITTAIIHARGFFSRKVSIDRPQWFLPSRVHHYNSPLMHLSVEPKWPWCQGRPQNAPRDLFPILQCHILPTCIHDQIPGTRMDHGLLKKATAVQ